MKTGFCGEEAGSRQSEYGGRIQYSSQIHAESLSPPLLLWFVLLPVRQNFPHRILNDIPGGLRPNSPRAASPSRLASSRIAIGVGSRGISNIATIVRSVVDYWRAAGMRPFLFPAMGSHGAGTAEGRPRARALRHRRIDHGLPLVSPSTSNRSGHRTRHRSVHGQRCWASDGIFVVGRVKWHTSFTGPIESGLSKMIAIGLGKRAGAESVHAHARKHGMVASIRSVASKVLASGKVLGGLAILEDAYHDTAQVAAVAAEGLMEKEEELLRTVKSWMGRIPVSEVDVLIVDEIGKNISGTGTDLKIVNRGCWAEYNPWPDAPIVHRIFVRDISALSHGNGNGMGAADVRLTTGCSKRSM